MTPRKLHLALNKRWGGCVRYRPAFFDLPSSALDSSNTIYDALVNYLHCNQIKLMKSKLIPAALALMLASAARADYNPVALAPGSFNFDIVVEKTAALPEINKGLTTATMDSPGINGGANTWYEMGFDGAALTTGLPHSNTIFSASSSSAHQFKMPPNYATNNALYVDSTHGGSLTPTTPAVFNTLSFLNSSGNGPLAVNYTVSYADGTTQTGSFSSPDWFGSGNLAYTANGRVRADTFAFADVNVSKVKLWYNDVTISATNGAVTNIAFAYGGTGGRGGIFAVSGSTGGTFTPINVTGFTQDMIVEGPPNLAGYTTASMDNGTNNTANTWYEQGYDWQAPLTGLPPAGATFTSFSLPDHHYTMPASYTAPNAILIDTNHQTANITPATPTNYTAFSLLTAGGTIGGANVMTNLCIMQHADGTSETNLFFAYDWFNNAIPYAYNANGRLSLSNRQLNNVSNSFPRLFESQFGLINTVSPVTNIVLKYSVAPAATATTYIMAVSATAGAVLPVISLQPVPANVFPGGTTHFTVSLSAGTPPITYQWQKGTTNGGFFNLTDGGNISGANLATLNVASASAADVSQYRVIVSNVVGPVTSAAVPFTLLSTLADVTTPGDPNSSFIGATLTPNGAANTIDNTNSTFAINGVNGAVPFTGPSGLVVSPSLGSTIVTGIRLYAANNNPQDDPADYLLEGSTDGGSTFTFIASNSISMPAARNLAVGTPVNPTTQFLAQDTFTNGIGYSTYRVTFLTVKDPTTAGTLQIGEIELLGVADAVPPLLTQQPAPAIRYVGGTATFKLGVAGVPPLAYQWFLNGSTPISNATNNVLTLTNVQLLDSGKTYNCTASDIYGSTNSTSALLTVIAAPTNSYPTTVIADHPVAFWRLGEQPDDGAGNNGVTAFDYVGGNNGIYTNALLQQTGYSGNDTNMAVQFGALGASDSFVGQITNIDYSTPLNSSVAFSVEAWVLGGAQSFDAGIISKGAGGGGEQFNLDTGGTARAFRFFVRDSAGATHLANTGTVVPDGSWHHVVGVCDEPHSNVVLYVDGVQRSVVAISPTNGLLNSTAPVSIGSRRSAATTNYNSQFFGTIDEAAIYSYALSSNQVLAHYLSLGFAPSITSQPTNSQVNEGSIATFRATVFGTPVLGYQWYDVTAGPPGTPLAGKTTPTLSFTNVSASLNGTAYALVVSNNLGTITSDTVQLQVVSGPPTILVDVPAQSLVYAGRTVSIAVTAGGTPPFTYQWQLNSGNLSDNARISGSHSNILTIANAQAGDAGNYQVLINNASGGPTSSGADALIVATRPSFGNNGLGWQQNAGANFNSDVLTLTDSTTNGQARSSFFTYPLYIDAFVASFTYQDVGIGGADGAAFVLQNSTNGAFALGGAGGSLGYGGLTPSAALELNIYQANGVGISFRTNGQTGPPYNDTSPVDISNGDPVNITIAYAQGQARVTLTNATASTSFTATLDTGDLPTILGAHTAFVGVTAADGGTLSTQQISNFSFVSFPALSTQLTGANTIVLSWPASVGGFVLQKTSSLSPISWQNVVAPITLVGGQNQVTLPAPAANEFYRLSLP
jgi:hypothetical protein